MTTVVLPEVDHTDVDASTSLTSICFAFLSLVLIALVVFCKIAHLAGLEEVSVLLFGFFGLGSAPLQMFPSVSGLRFTVYTTGIGIAAVLIAGWALVELPLWKLGVPLFVIFAIASVPMHLIGLQRNLSVDVRRKIGLRVIEMDLASTRSHFVMASSFLGFTITLVSAFSDLHLSPKPGGLLTSITPFWYIGIGSLLISFLIAYLFQNSLIAIPAVLLTVGVTLTPSIVYDISRYSWTQADIGLTLYFLQHGSANVNLNIYDSFPGFYGGIAWLIHVGGASNIEVLARYWQPIVDLVGALMMRQLAKVAGARDRNSWLAAVLLILANTVGQDYYCPQAIAFVGFIIALSIGLRPRPKGEPVQKDERSGVPFIDWAVLVGLSVAITVSHPLTPFALSGMFIVLACFGVLKSRWMVLVPSVPALIWAAIHSSVILKYFHVGDIGNISSNLSTPGKVNDYHYALLSHYGTIGQEVGVLAVGLLALVALVNIRDRISLALAVCVASTGLLVVGVHYGNEVLFRSVLFSLPPLIALGCRWDWRTTRLGSIVISGLAPLLTTTYLFGDTAFDYVNVVRPDDLKAIEYLETNAPAGATFIYVSNVDYVPDGSSPRLALFATDYLDLPTLATEDSGDAEKEARVLTATVEQSVLAIDQKYGTIEPVYVVTFQQAAAVWANGGQLPVIDYQKFSRSIGNSDEWRLVQHTPTATLYAFRGAEYLESIQSGMNPNERCHSISATSTVSFTAKQDSQGKFHVLALGTVKSNSMETLRNVFVTWSISYQDLSTSPPMNTEVQGGDISADGMAPWGQLGTSNDGPVPPTGVHVIRIRSCN